MTQAGSRFGLLEGFGLGHRVDIQTYFDLLDAAEVLETRATVS